MRGNKFQAPRRREWFDNLDSTSILNPKGNTKIPKLTTKSVDKLFKPARNDFNRRVPTSKVFVPNLFAVRKIEDAKSYHYRHFWATQRPGAGNLPPTDQQVPKNIGLADDNNWIAAHSVHSMIIFSDSGWSTILKLRTCIREA